MLILDRTQQITVHCPKGQQRVSRGCTIFRQYNLVWQVLPDWWELVPDYADGYGGVGATGRNAVVTHTDQQLEMKKKDNILVKSDKNKQKIP